MKTAISLIDNNCAMRAWLKQANVNSMLRQNLRKATNAPWVAKIKEDGSLEFLKAIIDYSGAVSMGSKGVVYRFILDSGNKYKACIYERGKAIISHYQVNKNGEIIKT